MVSVVLRSAVKNLCFFSHFMHTKYVDISEDKYETVPKTGENNYMHFCK